MDLFSFAHFIEADVSEIHEYVEPDHKHIKKIEEPYIMIIDNEINGILIPVGDLNALLNAMNKIAGDESFSQQISIEGIKLRERLSIQAISEKWISLF